jgi:hypothetical protein
VICGASENAIRSDVTLSGKLLIAKDGKVTVSYAPFEHVERSAKVVIVGITPGQQQAANAPCELRRRLLAGDDHPSALAAAKVYASFSGDMRTNLVKMLDHIGIPRWLGIRSANALWTTHTPLAHFTSALRYPVFYNGDNFNGQVKMTSYELLVRLLDECLADEAAALPDAVWLPVGPVATIGVKYVAAKRSLKVLSGLPHPSPANNERIQYFLGQKPRAALSSKTDPTTIDAGRESLLTDMKALISETANGENWRSDGQGSQSSFG